MQVADTGVIYVAFGRPYLAMALLSGATLRRSNPGLPICLITNVTSVVPSVPFWQPDRDSLIFLDEDVSRNREVKTSLHKYSPFDRSIFLDCDTIVMGDLSTAVVLLEHFDVGLRLNPYPQRAAGKGDVEILAGVRASELPHWNSGVVLFRRGEATNEFFSEWNAAYNRLAISYDQVALVEAIFRARARVLSLEARWNATDPGLGRKRWRQQTRVFHYGSNISDQLLKKICAYDKFLRPEDEGDQTLRFLLNKRQSKRRKLGLVKYAALRTLWKLSSPI